MIKHAALFIALPLLAQPLPINNQLALQDSSPQHLIAFMGDSYASGEGAPQRGATKWASEPCHRSEENGRFRAAQLLSSLVPSRTVLTPLGLRTVDDFQFTDVSCSGATITSGIVGPYSGVERMRPDGPGPKADLKPQIDQVESWMKAAPATASPSTRSSSPSAATMSASPKSSPPAWTPPNSPIAMTTRRSKLS